MKRWTLLISALAISLVVASLVYLGTETDSDESIRGGSSSNIAQKVSDHAEGREGKIAATMADKRPRRAEDKRVDKMQRAADRERADKIRKALRLVAESEKRRPSADAPLSAVSAGSDTQRPPSDMKNRGGFDPELVKVVNSEFMPLVDECVEMAKDRDPKLSGMLALQVGAAGDADLGAVVDYVRFADINEIVNVSLMECVQESAFSLILPAPQENGREDMEWTIPIEAQ